MAVVAAGALALAGCTSDTGDNGNNGGNGGDNGEASGGSGEPETTGRQDLTFETNEDTVTFSSGSEQYNAYNTTADTNSTYNSTVNNMLFSSFWHWGTDGEVYKNEWFGDYEVTSEDPLTVEYTISDDAVWSDGTPITINDYLLQWASENPEKLGGADLGFEPVSTDWGAKVPEGPQGEIGGKTFTIEYAEPDPDYELRVGSAMPSHVAAKEAGMEPDELAQAIMDGDGKKVGKVVDFWNTGWLFDNYEVTDEALFPSSGPYTLEGATWEKGQSLTLVPNEEFWGPAPATGNLRFAFVAPEGQVQALQNGEINVIEPQATVDTLTQLEGLGESVTTESGDQFTWEHLDYNFAKNSPFHESKGGLAAREAFAMCVPRQKIVDDLIKPINPEAQVLNLRERMPFQEDYEEVAEAAYDGRYDEVDIEGAKAKLKESGLETPVKVRIGFSAPNQRRSEEVAAIAASCKEAGFDVKDVGAANFFEGDGALANGDYEVALFAWAGSGQVASGQPIYSTGGGQNFGGYSNEEVDKEWKTLAGSMDPEVHAEQTKKIEKLLWDDLYSIPLFAHPGVTGYDSRLENVRPTAVQTGISWNADQWVRAE